MARTWAGGCECAISYCVCDLDLIFDITVVILTFKVLSGLCQGYCYRSEDALSSGMTLF